MAAMLREHKNRGNLLRYQKFQETLTQTELTEERSLKNVVNSQRQLKEISYTVVLIVASSYEYEYDEDYDLQSRQKTFKTFNRPPTINFTYKIMDLFESYI